MSIEQAYNSWAMQYDTNQNKTRDLDKKSTITTLSKYLFDKVIELGCGTGKNTVWLLEHTKEIIGLDFSEEMLNKAKTKIKSDKVIFQKADLLQPWSIDNDFADLVTCSLTLEHIKDMDFVFGQAYQKLSAEGLFFISELHPIKQYMGSKARFENAAGKEEVLEVYVHHLSEYLSVAKKHDFELVEIEEWFDEEGEKEMPRLLSFVFRK